MLETNQSANFFNFYFLLHERCSQNLGVHGLFLSELCLQKTNDLFITPNISIYLQEFIKLSINYKRNTDNLQVYNYQLNMNNKEEMQPNKQQKNKHMLEECQADILSAFLKKNKGQLGKQMNRQNIRARIVPDQEKYLDELGEIIRNGQLVAFPTETVYGLGADATNESALLEIYRVKKRPLTDPIIVHVLDIQSALKLVQPSNQQQRQLFIRLANKYWPGPLTIISKANLKILPKVVTAQTGMVGIRSPKSKFARSLIEKSQRPIGAPSANLFSHVSPTSAVHVFNDFYDQKIAIVDGQNCEYGIQSTVVKITDQNLQILRQGSLSTNKLSQFVRSEFGNKINISVKKRVHKEQQKTNMEAPGQLLKHYAPYLPCYSTNLQDLKKCQQELVNDYTRNTEAKLNQSVLISFSSQFDKFSDKFKYYLSVDGLKQSENTLTQYDEEDQKFCTVEQRTKMRSLYYLLRKAENLDAQVILIGWSDPKQGTLWDKIFRSTQGLVAKLI